ncbi:MAG TPA: T9SS type A sorting domain-containing protein [Bacteroidia bacterium]|nr:T9SS type A sorting domain-containing protein [Bacteroidia bacterium]
MIKKLFTLGLVIAAFAGNAQQLKTTQVIGKDLNVNTNWASKMSQQVASTYSITIDTLRPTSISTATACGIANGLHNYLAYSTRDSGFAFGTAIAQTFTYNVGTVVTVTATTSGLAQKYNVGSAAATITNVLVLPGAGSGTVTTTSASIYSGTSNKVTGAALGTSAAVAMPAYHSAMTATTIAQGYVSYSFATPVAVAANANFFAAVTVPAIGGTDKDTMSVLTTKVGCSSNSADSLSWISTTYVIPTVGTQVQWSPIKDLFGAANNIDLMIFPVIDINSAGINDYVRHGDLSIYAASPNPANTSININFAVAKPATVEIQVYDITGKIVKTIKNNDVVAGKNAISVDVSNLEAGSYMYSINANGNKMFSKFIVTK